MTLGDARNGDGVLLGQEQAQTKLWRRRRGRCGSIGRVGGGHVNTLHRAQHLAVRPHALKVIQGGRAQLGREQVPRQRVEQGRRHGRHGKVRPDPPPKRSDNGTSHRG
jgi:hypothetical protein